MRFLRLDRALGLVAILSAVALTASGTASASDWPMFGLDPAHSGNDTAETLLGPANVASSTLAWSAAIGNDERCSPVAAGGLVYDVTQDYENQANTLRVQAFHADSGASAWETKLVGEWCFGATPAVGGGLLFVPDSNNGNLTRSTPPPAPWSGLTTSPARSTPRSRTPRARSTSATEAAR